MARASIKQKRVVSRGWIAESSPAMTPEPIGQCSKPHALCVDAAGGALATGNCIFSHELGIYTLTA